MDVDIPEKIVINACYN